MRNLIIICIFIGLNNCSKHTQLSKQFEGVWYKIKLDSIYSPYPDTLYFSSNKFNSFVFKDVDYLASDKFITLSSGGKLIMDMEYFFYNSGNNLHLSCYTGQLTMCIDNEFEKHVQ